jgi:hypothetical protein
VNFLLKKISLLFFFFLPIILIAQTIPSKENFSIEEFIEQLAESSEEELDYTTIYDDLYSLLDAPINLNTGLYEDFEKLQILTEYQIKSIIYYRERYGQYFTIYELQFVDGFDFDLISSVLPFLSISDEREITKLKPKNALKYGNHQLFVRTINILEEQDGYNRDDSSGYLGSPTKLYTKYKYQYKNQLFWGVTAEKDAGEEFFKGNQKNGYDYYSAHFLYKGKGTIKRLAVGDYIMRYGQGLVMWSGMGTGKSSYVLNMRKRGQGISKYSSTDENRFQRGVATTLNYKNIDFSVFFSYKNNDANLQVDTAGFVVHQVTSFLNSGFHRTYNELEDKDAIQEIVSGGNVTYNHKLFKAGITYVNQSFDKSLESKNDLADQFDFAGAESSNLSADYQFSIKDFYVFGELARSQNGAFAYINGVTVALAPQMQLAAIYRNYAEDYFAFYGDAFAEGATQNEKGIYLGTEIYPIRNWKISAYYDNYKFPWLRYNVDAPSHGNDYLMQVDYTPTRKFSMYWRFKDEQKQISIKQEDQNNEKLDLNIVRKLRYHLSYNVSEQVTLKSRIELSFFEEDNQNETGYMIYQDVQYRSLKFPLVLNFRFASFDTESFSTAIYAYENDVLYGFSIPAYYSKGIRTYLTLKYSISEKIDVWLRYAQTSYADKTEIGSGLALIDGNKKSEVKFQIRYKF